jgi:hypothetical protein
MKCAKGCENGRGDRVSRFERRMIRFARVVRAASIWWDVVPPAWRWLAILVVLQLLGLWPPVAGIPLAAR